MAQGEEPGQPDSYWTPEELAAAQQAANQYYSSRGIPEGWGTPDDLVNTWAQARRQGQPIDINAAAAMLGWDRYQAPAAAPPPPDGGGGGGGGTGLPSPFTSTYTQPPPVNLGGPAGIEYIPPTPTFQPPGYTKPPPFTFDKFVGPTEGDVLADPSYQFREKRGLGAISNSQAARGLWASGATGKAFNDYAQDFASQEFSNVYNRNLNTYMANFNNALNTYATNAETQYRQPFEYAYTSAKDSFMPEILGYQTKAQAGQRQNELNVSNAYQKWLDDYSQRYGTARFLFDVNAA